MVLLGAANAAEDEHAAALARVSDAPVGTGLLSQRFSDMSVEETFVPYGQPPAALGEGVTEWPLARDSERERLRAGLPDPLPPLAPSLVRGLNALGREPVEVFGRRDQCRITRSVAASCGDRLARSFVPLPSDAPASPRQLRAWNEQSFEACNKIYVSMEQALYFGLTPPAKGGAFFTSFAALKLATHAAPWKNDPEHPLFKEFETLAENLLLSRTNSHPGCASTEQDLLGEHSSEPYRNLLAEIDVEAFFALTNPETGFVPGEEGWRKALQQGDNPKRAAASLARAGTPGCVCRAPRGRNPILVQGLCCRCQTAKQTGDVLAEAQWCVFCAGRQIGGPARCANRLPW